MEIPIPLSLPLIPPEFLFCFVFDQKRISLLSKEEKRREVPGQEGLQKG
jgi:hypothetical protein